MTREPVGSVIKRRTRKCSCTKATCKCSPTLFARIRYEGRNGRTVAKEERVASVTAGRKLVKKWSAELDEGGPDFLDATKITFADLADKYEAAKLISAEYRGPEDKKVKVKGLRSTEGPKRWLKTLRHHFGGWPIHNITHADIEAFKNERLDLPVQLADGTQKPREISTVNRELELLRAMFNSTVRYGWLRKSPFRTGDPLISKAIENRRERVLTPLEEIRLLASCGGEEAEVEFVQKPKEVEYVRRSGTQFHGAIETTLRAVRGRE